MRNWFDFRWGLSERFKFSEQRDAACYLAALIDGEGTVYVPKTGKSNKRSIQVSNTDWDILDAMMECCQTLGIRYTMTETKPQRKEWSRSWVIMIAGRKNLEKVRRIVPLRAGRKRDALHEAISLYKYEGGWTRNTAEEVETRVAGFRDAEKEREVREALAIIDAAVGQE